jgi:parallel beta-helix repeat protein
MAYNIDHTKESKIKISRKYEKTTFGIILILVITLSLLNLSINFKPIKGYQGSITIEADGSINPKDAPIETSDKVTYKLTDHIFTDSFAINILRSNIILDGSGFIIKGSGNYSGILVNGKNVLIKNINIRGFFTGITVRGDNCIIIKNKIEENNGHGIEVKKGSNCIITENILVGNKEFGIYAGGVSSITIFKNNIENSNTGINLRSCSNSMIINNNLISNPYHGILIDGLSKNITVSHNEIKGILTGLVGGSSAITIIQASNITIKYNVVKESYIGIQFFISSYNTASGNDVKNTRHGIYLRQSSDISINYNLIQNNNNGIYLIKSTNNTINNNIIRQNEDGIRVQNSSHNIIYNNNFINNNHQVTDDSKKLPNISPSINNWDNGYPTGGNYWSNYSGKDEKKGPNQDIQGSDGIIDVPYVIYKDNKDNYPLMEPLMINITTPPIPNITIPTITITTSPIETSPTATHIATQPSQFDFSLLIILLIIIIAVATVIAIVRVIKK